MILARDPVCKVCGRRPASAVDHVKPKSQGGEEYDEANLQGICKPCHTRKTAREAAEGRRRKKTAPPTCR